MVVVVTAMALALVAASAQAQAVAQVTSSSVLWTTAIWGFGGAVLGAIVGQFVSGWLSRSLKISEFRQAWINDLRADIATYMGVAREWVRKHEEVVLSKAAAPRASLERERDTIAGAALVVVWRIKLRFNSSVRNPDKTKDDQFLSSLNGLIDPKDLNSPMEEEWYKRANKALEEARAILKREWERTKRFRSSR